MRRLLQLFLLLSVPLLAQQITLVPDPDPGAPAEHGLEKLEASLLARGASVERASQVAGAGGDIVVLAGLCSGEGAAAAVLKAENVPCPDVAEAVIVHHTQLQAKPALVLAGSDARGLMYAALDVARRVSWRDVPGAPFAGVRDVQETPYVSERAVSIYTMQRAYFESRLFDETHWERYFDLLAESRIDSFVVIFGYENGGFMAPLYPYFFNVDGFPDVELVGITKAQQENNTAAFRRMMEIAHTRGIDVTVAIWDHIYRGGVQGGGIAGASEKAGERVPGLVWGLTAENLASYNKAAVRKLIDVFPEIDALQFRMHGESGLKRDEMPAFWHEIFTMVHQKRPNVRVDLRAKELPDSIIEDALDQGLQARIATKFWMEQMGLPFHPTHINRQDQDDRRHGYADLMKYPQRYRVHWRLWNGGTTRLLLWADPDYVKRFAASAKLYDGDSYEVNEMLATKMLAEPHDREPLDILNPKYRYYDYEFERYWHFYQLWGRLGYNPNTPREVWEQEFTKRFGDEAGQHLMQGLHLASHVLPRIVAASYRYRLFPTTRGWAEMTRMGDLPEYAKDEEGSDIQQFMNVREGAKSILEGTDTPQRRPEDISRWYEHTSRQILKQISLAEELAGSTRGKEFLSTVTDLRILAYLAQYHSQRLRAGVNYNLFKESGDLFAFDDALEYERRAIQAWQKIVDSAGDVYNEYLAFGVHDKGFPRHWTEELQNLRQGLERLQAERKNADARAAGSQPQIAHVPLHRAGLHEPLRIRATVGSASPLKEVRVAVSKGNEYETVAMRSTGDGMYAAEIAPVGAESQIRYVIEAETSSGSKSTYPPEGKAAPAVVIVTADNEPPRASVQRAQGVKPGTDLKVTARVADPSGVKWVRLRYRHATQVEDYETAEMKLNPATGLYEGVIPGSFIIPKWDLMYFVEAVDTKGNGRMYPDLEEEMPYIFAEMNRGSGQSYPK